MRCHSIKYQFQSIPFDNCERKIFSDFFFQASLVTNDLADLQLTTFHKVVNNMENSPNQLLTPCCTKTKSNHASKFCKIQKTTNVIKGGGGGSPQDYPTLEYYTNFSSRSSLFKGEFNKLSL